jgi:hypothetical protein
MTDDETANVELEKVKRYLQWATVLVLVAVAVTAIDLTIKQGILRAVKEATKIGEPPVSASPGNGSDIISDNPMARTSRSAENGNKNAGSRFSGETPTADSKEDQPSSDVL